MAEMIKCKTCGAEIDKSVKICPNCGAKKKKDIDDIGSIILYIITVLTGLLLLMGVWGKI